MDIFRVSLHVVNQLLITLRDLEVYRKYRAFRRAPSFVSLVRPWTIGGSFYVMHQNTNNLVGGSFKGQWWTELFDNSHVCVSVDVVERRCGVKKRRTVRTASVRQTG